MMANIKSAKKRILQNQKRAAINNFRLSRIKTGIKSFESAVSGTEENQTKPWEKQQTHSKT